MSSLLPPVCTVPPGVAGEHAALGRGRAALVQRLPGAGADPDADGLPLAGCATAGRHHELAGLPAQRVDLAGVGVAAGLGGDVQHPPQVFVLGGEQPSGEVVLVPAGQGQHDRGAGGEAVDAESIHQSHTPCR